MRPLPSLVLASLVAGCASPGGAPHGAPADEPVASASSKIAPAEAPVAEAPAPAPASDAPAKGAAPVATKTSAESGIDAPPGTRIYAKTRFVWVRYEPSVTAGWLGFLWLGGYADIKEGPVRGGPGCNAWYAVKPRGFVCADGGTATTDANDPQLVAMRPYAPNLASPWPHTYGESRGAQRYRKLPTPEEQRGREWDLVEHQARIAAFAEKPHPSLVGVDFTAGSSEPLLLPELPSTLREERKRLLPLSTVAWSRDLVHEGRSFLLSADFLFVPKDRVAPYPVSKFHGVELGKDGESLPLAFFRTKARPKHKLDDTGAMVPTGDEWPRHAHVGLTGESREVGGRKYLETKEPGVFVAEADATVLRARETTPWGAKIGEPDTTGKGPPGRKTWMDASVLSGWLIAYEGTKPVYATLISPGRGGIPERGKDPIDTASTPVGAYPITGKFATATMVAPGEFIHSDVPWAQNFHGPHALHTAYWHDDWGDKKSAGCVNVSPIDGKWFFHWTDPPIPDGWHGIRYEPDSDPSTIFYVHS